MLHRRQREHVPPATAVPVLSERDRLGALDAAARGRHLRPRQHLQAAHREVPRVLVPLPFVSLVSACACAPLLRTSSLLRACFCVLVLYYRVISVFQCARSLAHSANFGTRTFPSGAIFSDIGTASLSPSCALRPVRVFDKQELCSRTLNQNREMQHSAHRFLPFDFHFTLHNFVNPLPMCRAHRSR